MKRAGEEYLVNDYVISGDDVEELQDIVTLLQQEQPEVATILCVGCGHGCVRLRPIQRH